MKVLATLLNVFQSGLMSHTQVYPHVHPHVDVSAMQDTGYSLAFIIFLIASAMLGSSLIGFFVGKTVVNRRYLKK